MHDALYTIHYTLYSHTLIQSYTHTLHTCSVNSISSSLCLVNSFSSGDRVGSVSQSASQKPRVLFLSVIHVACRSSLVWEFATKFSNATIAPGARRNSSSAFSACPRRFASGLYVLINIDCSTSSIVWLSSSGSWYTTSAVCVTR